MKAVIFILMILTAFSHSCHGSINRIEELNIFDIAEIDSLDQEYEEFVLNKIDSLRSSECVDPFHDRLEVLNKYMLIKLPCIQVFAIEDGQVYSSSFLSSNQYERFLYNSCDSTIYPFGGGHVRFSKFMKNYLPEIIKDKDAIKDLVILYLNTLRQEYDYYIISSKSDFENIWQKAQDSGKWMVYRVATKEEIEEDIKDVEKRINLFEILREENYYEVLATTWDNLNGNIEYWEFRISENVFEVYSNIILICRKGPYYQLK